jgi:hypothetical protein
MALIILAAAMLATGTVYAQSALPGNPFYGWKRASENIWLALSPNSVATKIMLAERRLQEWIAVADDPELSLVAIHEYEDAIDTLKAVGDEESLNVILSALEAQQVDLINSGLYSPELGAYLAQIYASLMPPVVTPATPAVTKPVLSAPTNGSATIPDIECPPNCGTGIGNSANHGGPTIGSASDNKGADGNSGIGNDDKVTGADGNNGSGNDDKVKGADGNNGGGNDDKGSDGNNGGGNDGTKDTGGGKGK